jgi:hypothetical protein
MRFFIELITKEMLYVIIAELLGGQTDIVDNQQINISFPKWTLIKIR